MEVIALVSATHALPPVWLVIPFVVLLLMIATGPLFYHHVWERYYPVFAFLLGFPVVLYYLFVLNDAEHPVHTLFEYISFLSLIGSLFIASSGILIKIKGETHPLANVLLLGIGAVLANIIGTTGASILLIRPYMRLNKDRISTYHIVFFIFVVSNIGGSLTPIGDPPLFLGFLKGVPFFWTVEHMFFPWLFGVGLILLLFYYFDHRRWKAWLKEKGQEPAKFSFGLEFKGLLNLLWLAIIIGSVFLDPAILPWLPAVNYHGERFSIVREIIMISVAVTAYILANKEILKENNFNFEPIKEVGFLFLGIFATMMPALQLVSAFAHSPEGLKLISETTLYWLTGSLSSVLDNAPTYLTFLAAAMGKYGLDINLKGDVLAFVANHPDYLIAISIAAVFFGAMTYIGNAPNFMVRNIAEQAGVDMPSFGGYVAKYSIVYLLPILALTFLVFVIAL